MEAMDTADRLKEEGIVTARENIAKLTQLSTDLYQRASGLGERADLPRTLIEA